MNQGEPQVYSSAILMKLRIGLIVKPKTSKYYRPMRSHLIMKINQSFEKSPARNSQVYNVPYINMSQYLIGFLRRNFHF